MRITDRILVRVYVRCRVLVLHDKHIVELFGLLILRVIYSPSHLTCFYIKNIRQVCSGPISLLTVVGDALMFFLFFLPFFYFGFVSCFTLFP